MIIECQACHARFRLDDSKIKGKGLKVRCRKCGDQIIVLKDAVPASPDSASDKNESLDLKSGLPDSPPDNLIRFPKQTSNSAAAPNTEEKDVDLAFEQLFKGAGGIDKPEAAEPNAAMVEPSPELPQFEPPTEALKFDPPAELTFETKAAPDFQAPVKEQTFDVPTELLPDKPMSHTFQNESFDLASTIENELPAMQEQPAQPPEENTDLFKEFETQTTQNSQTPVEEKTFDISMEFPFDDKPEASAFQDNEFDLALDAKPEPPAITEQQASSFEIGTDFLKELETQSQTDSKAPVEEPKPDMLMEFPFDDVPETSAFQDDAFDMAPDANPEPPAITEQQTQSFEVDTDFLKEFETQSLTDSKAPVEEPKPNMLMEFPFDDMPETSAFQDDAFDMAPDANPEPPAITEQQTQSIEVDTDFLKEFETQSLTDSKAPVEEPKPNMLMEFPFDDMPETSAFQDDAFDMAPDAKPEPSAITEQQTQSFEGNTDFLKEFETQIPTNFQVPVEKQTLYMPTEFPFDDKQETSAFQDNAFDMALDAKPEPPAITEQQAQSFENNTDFSNEFETQIPTNFQVPVEKQTLYMPTEFPFDDKQETPAFQDNAFDMKLDANPEPSATTEQQAQSFEDDIDFLKEFETQGLTDSRAPIEEPKPDMPTELMFDAPESSTFEDNAFDMKPGAATGLPVMNEQQMPSSKEEDDFFKKFETQALPNFQASVEEPKPDMPIDLPFEAPEPYAFEDNAFDMAPNATPGLPAVNEQPPESLEEDVDPFSEFETQIMQNFQMPEEGEPTPDTPIELPFDAPEPYALEDNTFGAVPEVTTEPPTSVPTPVTTSAPASVPPSIPLSVPTPAPPSVTASAPAPVPPSVTAPASAPMQPSVTASVPTPVPPSVTASAPTPVPPSVTASAPTPVPTPVPPSVTAPAPAPMPPSVTASVPAPMPPSVTASAPEQSLEEDVDPFSDLETQIMQNFQAPEEEKPAPDIPTDIPEELPLDTHKPSVFQNESFDLASELAAELSSVNEQPAQPLDKEADLPTELETQTMPNFKAPEEKKPAPDISYMPKELPLDTHEPSVSQNKSFDLASEVADELPSVNEQPAQPMDEDADLFLELETQPLPSFKAPEETKPAPDISDMPEELSFDDELETSAFKDDAPDMTPNATLDLLAMNTQQTPPVLKPSDISKSIASKPEAEDLFLERTAFEAADDASPPPAASDISVEGNDTPSYVYTPDTEPDPAPPYVHEENIHEETPEQIYAATKPSKPSAKNTQAQSGSRFLRVAGVVLLLALLSVAGYYFGFNEQGRQLAGTISDEIVVMFNEKVFGKTEAPISHYEVNNVIGYYDSGRSSQRIFVVRGQVTNLSSVVKSGIRIYASLLDSDGSVMMEQSVHAGNVVSGARIKTETRSALEKTLANPLGEHLSNVDITPGRTIPFMVLFFDAPESFKSYKIEANETP